MAGGITADIAQDTAAQSSYQSYMSEATRAKLGHTATLLSKWAGMDVIFIGPDDVDEGRNAPEESFVNNVMKQHPSYGDVGVNGKSLFEIQTQHINTGGPHSVAITPGLIDVLEKEDNIPIERNAPLSREVCIVYNPWLDLSAEEIAAEKHILTDNRYIMFPGQARNGIRFSMPMKLPDIVKIVIRKKQAIATPIKFKIYANQMPIWKG